MNKVLLSAVAMSWATAFVATSVLAKSPNVIFILSDDHRYDFMSFMDESPEFLETPNLDRIANRGTHLRNAFVTTSLCSPSRASILTGRYMHRHQVVDNQRPVPAGTKFFPQALQKSGYQTALIGKWHMGHDNDEPRPGFDHWVSFRGQGKYFDPELNINGRRKEFKGYNADVLTDQAIRWLKRRNNKPFFLYLSYKAVHYPFQPAKRHQGRYANAKIDYPETMANTEENYETQSQWIRERRYSIHGIDHMETGAYDKDPVPDFDVLFRSYCEAVHSVDENIGRVIDHSDASGLDKSTIVIYMGDNGFALGEHGFYDKRDAYEESIRVPLLAMGPKIKVRHAVEQMVQNIDIADTILELTNSPERERFETDGQSFAPLLADRSVPWRDHVLYEYHWEWNFPATPTLFAIRTDRYKYIYYHGVWDRDGFYDLGLDPHERHNLINVPNMQAQIDKLRQQMFHELQAMNGLQIPVRPPAGERLDDRKLRR